VKRIALLSMAIFALCACNFNTGGQPTPTLSPTATQTLTPTATPTPSPTPTPTPTATPQCAHAEGILEQTAYTSIVLGSQIPVHVFLPPCYEVPERIYPVIYLLHGTPMEVADWDTIGADELAGQKMAAHEWPDFMIIIPAAPGQLFTYTDGGLGSFEAEFVEGLLPWVEQSYRVDARREARALAGISRGGVWALEIGFRHADLFDVVGALSPALQLNDAREQYDPLKIVHSGAALPGRIFLGAGEGDWARWKTEEMSALLQQVGISAVLEIVPGVHEAGLWRALLPDVLSFLSSGF
jgi:enterochelin esterase-like enzyme